VYGISFKEFSIGLSSFLFPYSYFRFFKFSVLKIRERNLPVQLGGTCVIKILN